jgi:hypothetical protein
MEKEAEAATQKKWKENQDKKTLEEYKANRSSVGKVMDLFSREHAQEIGYAAEKKVEAHLKERRIENEIKARKKTEPLLIQNDLNLKEGKINEAMHADREKKYLGKMERMSTPIEQKVGGAVKREANSTFDILNEVMTSPEARNKINAQRVKEGKPITSAMEGNTIAATFARGLAQTNEQLHTRPPKAKPSIFSGATVEPAFSGQEMHRLPTSPSFYGVVPSARQPRAAKGAKGKAPSLAQKSGSQINFGGSAPISFGGGGYGLFGNSRPAPVPAPQPQKQPRKKR